LRIVGFFFEGVNHLNNLPNEYLITEQEINLDEKHDEEKEKILEKTRQVLEENKIKNEQLAKQVCFTFFLFNK
jgi:hypothetical protein